MSEDGRSVSRETSRPGGEALFGSTLPQIEQFEDLLAAEGELRGLIGPREVPRLWERHIVNSAAVGPYLPEQGTVVDIGSGAGLPGVVIACMRPDLSVELLEPMERRIAWLEYAVAELGLANVTITRARAQEVVREVECVTARAVAPLDKLVRMSFPLLKPDGILLALKGSSAEDEVRKCAGQLKTLGSREWSVLESRPVAELMGTTVVRVVKR